MLQKTAGPPDSAKSSFHLPFLFSALGDRKRTAYWAGRIRDEAFSPDVFPGDEDNGSMAAWYVFACLGLYPLCPGSGEYVLSEGIPGKIKIHLENGREVCIVHNQDASLCRSHITHREIMAGGTVIL